MQTSVRLQSTTSKKANPMFDNYDIKEAILTAVENLSGCSHEMQGVSAETIAELISEEFETIVTPEDVYSLIEE
jgi:hypothetical protein